ncbi:MAG: hypothetical protein K9N10_03540 [Deltaproteobacteria bacterium]|nr:hypothetical protein [Deltaproteobacteria bacterium]
MFSKIWLINAVLLCLFGFLALKAYGVWFHAKTANETPAIAIKSAQSTPKPLAALDDRKIPSETTYDALINLNLFHPDRTETIVGVPAPDAKSKKLSAKEEQNIEQYFTSLTLYGMVITHDSAEALVSYPVSKSALQSRKALIPKNRRRNVPRISAKENKWVKVGDTLGDFKVESVKPDRVVLKTGEKSYDLLLYDKENLKKRESAKPKSGPTVVGVTVTPEATALNGKKETIPPTAKKGIAGIAPSKVNPPMAQKNLKKAIEKNK